MHRRVRRQPAQQPVHVPEVNDLYRVVIGSEDHLTITAVIRIDTVQSHSVDATITRIEEQEALTGDGRAAFKTGDIVFVWRSQLSAEMKVS